MKKTTCFIYLSLLLLACATGYGSPVSYTGGLYSQNFNGMGASGTTTPTGWFVGSGTGAAVTGTTVVSNDGSSTASNHYNYGIAGVHPVTERALGSKNDSGGQYDTEVEFLNNTGLAITNFTISYIGEQWRDGGSGNQNSLIMQYSTNGLTWNNLGAGFNFLSLVDNPGSPTKLDGNAAANRTMGLGGYFALPTSVAPGAILYLRFADADNVGKDDGLAVDDFRFSVRPIPEPAPVAMVVAGGLLALLARGQKLRVARRLGSGI